MDTKPSQTRSSRREEGEKEEVLSVDFCFADKRGGLSHHAIILSNYQMRLLSNAVSKQFCRNKLMYAVNHGL